MRFHNDLIIFQTVVDFINSQAAFSPTGSRAALIEFSSPRLTSVVLSFKSTQYQYAYDVKNLINSLGYDSGACVYKTYMPVLFIYLFIYLFEPPRGQTNNVVSEQVRHKPTCTSTEKSYNLEISDLSRRGIVLSE